MIHTASVTAATAIGFCAILLWASLALFATMAGPIPPFQMTAMAFALAFALAFGKWIVRRENVVGHLVLPVRVWALGVGGLFGYHVCYFAAIAWAPPVEANLINYLWPLLIVVFSGLLPGERLRWWHLAGTALGLIGCITLIGGGAGGIRSEYSAGYLAALAAALTWSSYSVLSRRVRDVPTDAVGGFCGATAVLALVAHLLFETTYVPQGGEWLAALALGLGPVGAAFYVWDYGVKRGDIKALGALSYMTPLLSTLLLVVFGRAQASLRLGIACLLIVGGAALASKELWRR